MELFESLKKDQFPDTAPEVTAPERPLLNFVEDLQRQREDETRSDIELAKRELKDVPADRALDAIKIKRGSIIPYRYILDNLDELKKEAKDEEFDIERFSKESPLTSAWLSRNPEYTPLFRDYFGDTSFWESSVNTLKAIGRGAGGLIKSAGATLAKTQFGWDDLSYAEGLTWLDAPEFVRERMIRDAREARKKEIEQGLAPAQSLRQRLGQSIAEYTTGPLGRKIMQFGQDIQQAESLQDPFHTDAGQSFLRKLSQRPIETAIVGTAEQLPNLAAVVVSAMAFKKAPYFGAVGTSFVLEAGEIQSEGLDFLSKRYGGYENIPREELNRLNSISTNHGAFNASLDAILPGNIAARRLIAKKSIRKLMSAEGLKYSGKEMFKDVVREVSTEVIQSESTIQAREKVTGKEVPWNKRLDEYVQAGTGALLLSGGTSVIGTRSQIKLAQDAINAKEIMEGIASEAGKNEINKKSPEVVKDLVNDLTKDGQIEDIYIPADKATEYFQSKKLDPKKELAKVGISEQEYDDAIANGYDLKIKTADYAATIAIEHGAELAQDIRLGKDKMTAREGEQLLKDTIETSKTQDTVAQESAQYENTVVEKLVNAGYSKQEAQVAAANLGLQGLFKGGEPVKKILDDYINNRLDIKGPAQLKQEELELSKSLANIQVDIPLVVERTSKGKKVQKTVTQKVSAQKALSDADARISRLSEILKCLKS